MNYLKIALYALILIVLYFTLFIKQPIPKSIEKKEITEEIIKTHLNRSYNDFVEYYNNLNYVLRFKIYRKKGFLERLNKGDLSEYQEIYGRVFFNRFVDEIKNGRVTFLRDGEKLGSFIYDNFDEDDFNIKTKQRIFSSSSAENSNIVDSLNSEVHFVVFSDLERRGILYKNVETISKFNLKIIREFIILPRELQNHIEAPKM